ncbi:MAG TPA: carboxypeptidase-like regulatory domain-containing protein [Thermoanaerobaculia bacterium]|jgi:hypothetical protein
MRSRIVLTVVFLLSLASTALAETVRGKVVYPDGSTAYPNVEVTLISGSGKATVLTGTDGMFHLVRVPPGQYRIEIKSPRETKAINVNVAAQPYTDLPPVALN